MKIVIKDWYVCVNDTLFDEFVFQFCLDFKL